MMRQFKQFKCWAILTAAMVCCCRRSPADDLVEVDFPVNLNDKCAMDATALLKSVDMTLTLWKDANTVQNDALQLVLLKDGVVASNMTFTAPSYSRRDLVAYVTVRIPGAKSYQWASCSLGLHEPLFLEGRRGGYIAFVANNEFSGRLSGDARRRVMWTNGVEVVTQATSSSYAIDLSEIQRRLTLLGKSTIIDQRQYEVDWSALRDVYTLVTGKTVDTMGTNRAAVLSERLRALTVHSNDAFCVRMLDTNVALVASTTRALQGVEEMVNMSGEAVVKRIRNLREVRFVERGGPSLCPDFDWSTCPTNEWIFLRSIDRMMDRANTLRVCNRSGEDLSELVVMKGSLPLVFTDLGKFSNSSFRVLKIENKMDVRFDATAHFRDGTAVQSKSNCVVTLEPVPQREVSVNILSNRVVEINVTEKRNEWSPR